MRRLILLCVLFSFCVLAKAQPECTRTLSLDDAILLSVRENPNVQQAQLNLVMQKYALDVAKWQFQPHYAFTATKSTTRTVSSGLEQTQQSWGAQPAVSLLTPVGTQLTLTSTNNVQGHYNPALTLQVVQPLIRGFGRPVVEAALYNAMDSERISRLNVQNALRTTVTSVINAYLDVITAQNTIDIDRAALKRAQTSVEQTKLFIKAGRKAGVELVTVQADVANAQTKLENDKNNLDQMRYALLTAIGLDPNLDVKFTSLDVPSLTRRYKVPTLDETKHLTLENDIQFQVDQITLYGSTKRNLLVAEDNTRWQLNLTVNAVEGNGSGGGANSGLNSLSNGDNQNQSAVLNLTVPIDDRNAKQAVVNARIALKEAGIALKQEKWTKETNAINGWNTIYSAQRAMKFAEDAEQLQQKTYHISFQKYSYGLIDSLELQSVQQQLIEREQALLAAKVSYLKALINLDQQIGGTLKTWNIQTRYS
jgi:outer membrane protein TolC